MSHRRGTERGARRGSEQPWRSRGNGRDRGLGRGSIPPAATPVEGSMPMASRAGRQAMSSESFQRRGIPRPAATDDTANRRRMHLMASVSRSSGLEKDGDDLKNYQTQEEYRRFIQEKVDDVFKHHPRTSSESEDKRKQRIDAQENVLILFRKLREGVASSGRTDVFALEVYETSLYLSAIFESPKQTISVIHHLFPPRLSSSPSSPSTAISITVPSHSQPSIHAALTSLIHHLVVSYPSQSAYHQQLDAIPTSVLPRASGVADWLTALTKALRMRNYARISFLSQRASLLSELEKIQTMATGNEEKTDVETTLQKLSVVSTPPSKANPSQGLQAVFTLLAALRRKASETAWTIIRSAYRELTCDQSPAGIGTKSWLARSLCMEPVFADSISESEDATDGVERWLEARVPLGHVRRKEGIDGRWIVCKLR